MHSDEAFDEWWAFQGPKAAKSKGGWALLRSIMDQRMQDTARTTASRLKLAHLGYVS